MKAVRGAEVIDLLEFHGYFIVRTHSRAAGIMEWWRVKVVSQYSIIPTFHFFEFFSLTRTHRSLYKGELLPCGKLLFRS